MHDIHSGVAEDVIVGFCHVYKLDLTEQCGQEHISSSFLSVLTHTNTPVEEQRKHKIRL